MSSLICWRLSPASVSLNPPSCEVFSAARFARSASSWARKWVSYCASTSLTRAAVAVHRLGGSVMVVMVVGGEKKGTKRHSGMDVFRAFPNFGRHHHCTCLHQTAPHLMSLEALPTESLSSTSSIEHITLLSEAVTIAGLSLVYMMGGTDMSWFCKYFVYNSSAYFHRLLSPASKRLW